jgi:hypothetical protein
MLWTDKSTIPPDRYAELQYDLMRIGYDTSKGTWSESETVLSAAETGQSILMPRISPDGRFLLFCMCDYGCFPAYQVTSDLYLLDLRSGVHTRLAMNSSASESWHSWSSNSRWIAFSSKRDGGFFTRCYLSYVDATGSTYKPFVLPQSDPTRDGRLLKTYSVPEFTTGPIKTSKDALAAAVRSPEGIDVDALSGASAAGGARDPWRPTME